MKQKWLYKIVLKVAPVIASNFSLIMGKTTKLKLIAPEDLNTRQKIMKNKKGVIFSCWHSRFFYFSYFGRNEDVTTMISASKDGEIITQIIKKLGLAAVRGSTSRYGKEALAELVDLVKEGKKVLMIPDGPRGPRYNVKAGVIKLAQLTGCPIIPVTFSTTSGIFLSTWDHFLVPLPFGSGVVVLDEPIYVPSDIKSEDGLEKYRLKLQNSMNNIIQKADKITKRDPKKEAVSFLRRKKHKKHK